MGRDGWEKFRTHISIHDKIIMLNTNIEIWDEIYAGGRILWYPYEVAVRITRYLKAQNRLKGTILDHGCGSGNHLELFTRLGLRAVGTDVSPAALDTVRRRFEGAQLSPPDELVIFDPRASLSSQLPRYDHVFAWGSIHYNNYDKMLQDIQSLVSGMTPGGSFIIAVPSRHDIAIANADEVSAGMFRLKNNISGQIGALVCAPADESELKSWCTGIEIEDCGRFGWDFRGQRSEFIYLFGRKG